MTLTKTGPLAAVINVIVQPHAAGVPVGVLLNNDNSPALSSLTKVAVPFDVVFLNPKELTFTHMVNLTLSYPSLSKTCLNIR